jgi:hypothetical protein
LIYLRAAANTSHTLHSFWFIDAPCCTSSVRKRAINEFALRASKNGAMFQGAGKRAEHF